MPAPSRRQQEQRRSFDFADTSRREAEHKTGGGGLALNRPQGLKFWSSKNEAFELDILGFVMGDRATLFARELIHAKVGQFYYEQTYWMHREVGPNQDKVTCPAATFGLPCPVCEFGREARQNPKYSKEDLKEFKAKERQLFLIFDHDQPKEGIQLWDESYWNFGINLDDKIKKAHESKQAAYRRFYHPDEGFTVRITAREKRIGKGEPFNEYFVDDFLERPPLPDELVEHGICLNDLPAMMSYADLYAKFYQQPTAESARAERPSREATEAPAPRTRAAVSTNGDAPPPRRRAEPAPAPPPADDTIEFKVGDPVTFEYRGRTLAGTIDDFNGAGTLAYVAVEGDRDLHSVGLDDLTLDETPADPEPPPPPTRTRREAPAPAAEPEPAPAPRSRSRAAAPPVDADEPFQDPPAEVPAPRRRAAPAAEPEPAPAPARRARR